VPSTEAVIVATPAKVFNKLAWTPDALSKAKTCLTGTPPSAMMEVESTPCAATGGKRQTTPTVQHGGRLM
jgi:hypothetical protein